MDIKFNLITLFPEIYDALDHGLIGKAIQNNVIELNKIQLRDFAINKHGQIDGKPFGGEKGMICLLYTSPSPRDMRRSRMPSSA